MARITVKESAAAQSNGTDLMSGNRLKTSGSHRAVTKIGFVGSANAGDASCDLFVGDTYHGTFYNTTGGANKVPTQDVDMVDIAVVVPAGDPISLLVSDPGVTNVLVASLDIQAL